MKRYNYLATVSLKGKRKDTREQQECRINKGAIERAFVVSRRLKGEKGFFPDHRTASLRFLASFFSR